MRIKKDILEHISLANEMLNYSENIEELAKICCDTIKNEKKIILAGNGGSASDSQHIAAEFVGRFVKERESLPAIALTTDTSAITAIGNDYGFDNIFSRQLSSIGEIDDVFIAISTSGNSPNLINAINIAKSKKITTIGLLGKDGGLIKKLVDHSIVVPCNTTARIQEIHILIGHLICKYVEKDF